MMFEEFTNESSPLLLNCISGSQAYGLALPTSDTDVKGVYVVPKRTFYGLSYNDHFSKESNDINYYELRKFVDLLLKNNPNILELLNTPEECIMFRDPVMELLKTELFLSKLCNQTFGQYAYSQIKKARGLNKKILNPIDKKRKTIIDFCYVVVGQVSVPVTEWLQKNELKQEDCGLVKIDHMRDMYALFHQSQSVRKFSGIFSGEEANDVSLSSVEDGLMPVAIMSFNKDGYSVYCREYKQYWEWVGQRNEARYENTISHGKNYDSKNMMHVFRLLNMAEEIARYKKVNVRRHDREWLLKVRAGKFEYDDLLKMADEKMAAIDQLFRSADLPDQPDAIAVESVLIQIRETVYH